MAMINTLRKRMGKIVVGFVAFSMFAFILTDLLQSNSALLGGNDQTVAEIAGSKISYQEFQAELDQLTYTFAINNNGRNPSTQELQSIREQAWNSLILNNAYSKQYEALGLSVTNEEVVDMVQGNNIDPQIIQFFSDPNTGEFSRESVIQFLQSLSSAPPAQRASWLSFETRLRPNRLVKKYENLFEKTNYITSQEAKSFYESSNSNATVDYLYVPFFSVADSVVKVTDAELKSFLSANSKDYQKEESRSLQYVSIPIVPSPQDSAFVLDEIKALKNGLANAQNDSTYAVINSDGNNPFQSISDPTQIPAGLQTIGSVVEAGTITDPVLQGSAYRINKLTSITTGDEFFVKARHILVKVDDTSASAKAEGKKKAQDILNRLRRGEDFAELAAVNSDDKSNANNGGDLGWFGENGNFVQPFKDAVFAHEGTGLLRQPVETSFGYHVIKIDEPKTNRVYKVASITKDLFASDQTMNEIYRQADLLSVESTNAAKLSENAKIAGFDVKTASNLSKNDTRVGVLSEARNIVSWLYRDADVDDVSEVFELDANYVVAAMTSKQEKGTANLSQVKNEVSTKVLNNKKADYIIAKIQEAGTDDFDAIKTSYGTKARTGQADLSLGSSSFPNIGFAPEAVGVAFSLEEGEKTAAFKITNGVIMLSSTAKNTPDVLDDYSSYTTQVQGKRQARKSVIANFPLSFSPVFVSSRIDNTIKEFAEIEDKRYKFF